MSRSPRRQIRRRARRASDAAEGAADEKSTSPVPSPGSWNVDRGRSRVRRPSNPFSEDNLRRKGYHSLLSSFGKVFHVEKRWKLVREMGSGAYGVVISAADEISGETVAIKMVTRVFDKVQLAKRALREITLLRHFSNHENITGLIDVDAISPDFNEIYIFMEPMEADLHQIIKSGQVLSNEHVQYFLYQILRGMKFIHSGGVIHRDLKPGNLLVNADCELKICDFGLSRGFDAAPDENASKLTEYVATRWYRAPEIMLAFPRYNTAIDVWSIGCILAELLLGKPLFKGKDYVDQLNKILDVLGSPDERIIKKIGSDKAQAYVRSLPFKKTVPFRRIFPTVDSDALDVMAKMLAFDPEDRVTVFQALEHPWLAAYHDESDEPVCTEHFERWREIEKLETIEDFRTALWNEIEDYRREVRGIHLLPPMPAGTVYPKEKAAPEAEPEASASTGEKAEVNGGGVESKDAEATVKEEDKSAEVLPTSETVVPTSEPEKPKQTSESTLSPAPPPPTSAPLLVSSPIPDADLGVKLDLSHSKGGSQILDNDRIYSMSPEQYRTDPVVTYARRSSILQPSRQGSTFNSPIPSSHHLPTFIEDHESLHCASGTGPTSTVSNLGPGTIAFPSMQQQGYVVPARSRTGSTAGGEVTRKLLRTLSTVSIHDSTLGRVAGLTDNFAFIMAGAQSEADAPPSEMPMDFTVEEESEQGTSSAKSKGSGSGEGGRKKGALFQL